MNYLKDIIDPWLDTLLLEIPNEKERKQVKREFKEKIPESYRNGQAAGTKKAEPTRDQ